MGDAPARAEAARQQPQPAPAAPTVPPQPKLWGVRQQDPPCCIVPQVFLGSAATESNREWLDAANITHVLQASPVAFDGRVCPTCMQAMHKSSHVQDRLDRLTDCSWSQLLRASTGAALPGADPEC